MEASSGLGVCVPKQRCPASSMAQPMDREHIQSGHGESWLSRWGTACQACIKVT